VLKVVKKAEGSFRQTTILRIVTVVIALFASSLVIAALGYNPVNVYSELFQGATGSLPRWQETINKAIPLIVLSLGISVAFKMKFWNIGAEGQFYMGAMGATYVALNFKDLPSYLLLPFMMFAGFLFGGLWILIPAILKLKLGTSETLVTLMLNYVAISFITYLQYGPWKDPTAMGFAKIPNFTDNAVLPKVLGVHIGWIISLILVLIIYILMKYTKLGYEITVLGENIQTAKYAGMNVTKILIIAVFISGGLCGLAGMLQSSGVERSLSDQISNSLGFTAIITSWLAGLSAPAILIVSILFAILLQGGAFIQSSLQIPASVAEVIQGIILFFVLGSEFFINYKIVFVKSKKEAIK